MRVSEHAGVWPTPGRAGRAIVPGSTIRHRGTLRTMATPGNPRGTPSRCTSPLHEAGRRRAIGVVAAVPLTPRATAPMVRRSGASHREATQKASAEHRKTGRVESPHAQPRATGGMAEWSKALVLKTSEVQASVGSNPTPSASNSSDELRWRVGRANRAQSASGSAPLLFPIPFPLPCREPVPVSACSNDSGPEG